jgi:hypothetical protein
LLPTGPPERSAKSLGHLFFLDLFAATARDGGWPTLSLHQACFSAIRPRCPSVAVLR